MSSVTSCPSHRGVGGGVVTVDKHNQGRAIGRPDAVS